MMLRRPSIILSASIFLCLCATACGGSFTPGATKRREARPLAAIYDFLLSVPGLLFPQLAASGLVVDLTLEIEPGTLDGASEGFHEGRITIIAIRVAGQDRPFVADAPLTATVFVSAGEFSIDSFGPIMVGTDAIGFTRVLLSLTGTLADDGRTIAGAVLVTSSGETGTFQAIKQRRYLVAGTDFGVTGTVSLVKVRFNTNFIVEKDLEAISGDPIATTSGGAVFIVNRFFFDNIQSLDPASGFRTALQFSTGNGSNPHDALAVDPNRLYVTRYEPPFNDVLIADRGTGESLGFIDLAPLATNSSGTPRADSLVEADGLVLVSLQNVDAAFVEYGPGILAVVDPTTDRILSRITMVGRNPFGPPAVHPATGRLYFAMAGIFQGSLDRELSGGIEVIDPNTLTTLGLIVDDDDLGGNISAAALARAGGTIIGYCVVTLPSGVNVVRSFDPDTGAIFPATVFQSAAFLPTLASDGDGFLLIPVHDINDPRLAVLDAGSGRIVASLRLSLPPFSIAVLTRGFLGD